ncbi:hypothetical protein PQX77_006024 [Marasmius sp. AFHP31]|nr:hypothetical protein PQX77_006024 [Marasmius sp. AFHP31]
MSISESSQTTSVSNSAINDNLNISSGVDGTETRSRSSHIINYKCRDFKIGNNYSGCTFNGTASNVHKPHSDVDEDDPDNHPNAGPSGRSREADRMRQSVLQQGLVQLRETLSTAGFEGGITSDAEVMEVSNRS